MENASKALVIAGAILISILIIGLGVFIYNGAASTVSKSNLDSQEAQAQNQQFEAYFGAKKSAAEVKQLCSLVRSNNLTSANQENSKKILLIGDNIGNSGKIYGPQAISAAVTSGKTYNVNVANDNFSEEEPSDNGTGSEDDKAYYKNGFIRVITITQN